MPTGSMAKVVTFALVDPAKLRVVLTHQSDARSGLTELELWKE